MIKRIFTVLSLLITISFCAQNQSSGSSPNFISTATNFNIVPPLSQQVHQRPDTTTRMVNNNRWLNYPTNFNALPNGRDPLVNNNQNRTPTVASRAPIENFDGAIDGIDSGAGVPDPTGAVGPNHYIHAYNSGFAIFNKDGSVALPNASLGMLWPGETTGDPVVLYDRYAERFVITQFTGNPFGPPSDPSNGILFAICQGDDPVNDGWFTYFFPTGSFPDYPKYSIWHDGYYFTANKSGDHFYAVERDKMIVGDPTAQILGFILPNIGANPNTVFAPLPINSIGPNLPDSSSPGYVTYLQDDAWAGGVDHLKIWEVNLDWSTTSNSNISLPVELNTTPFDSFTAVFGSGEVPQPGTSQRIDGITGIVSYNCNYYNFDTHNSVTLNFNVDVNGDDSVLGIRWYELRVNDTGNWNIEQEGTFAPNDGLYRFMGSMAMDEQGNIGLAYNVGNASTFPSLRYTGRFANSPPGEMILQEQVIVNGGGPNTGTNRFGDYAHLTLDPTDNQTFWHTGEYIHSINQWRTRIASFKIAPENTTDVGVLAITEPSNGTLDSNESITAQLINYGTNTQSNIPVWYQIDGGAMVMQTYTGTLASTETVLFTFNVTADLGIEGQTYTITASTDILGDEDNTNDAVTKVVTSIAPNDVGIMSINSPTTGTGLTSNEAVEVTLQNFGGLPQTSFPVAYTLDGVTVTETFVGTLDVGEIENYTFSQTADLLDLGVYELCATTSLPNDSNIANDGVCISINHSSCIPAATIGCDIDGLKRFILGTIDVDDGGDGCNSTSDIQGYVNRTNLSTDLDRIIGNNTHVLQAQHNWAGGATIETLSAWVDFNDNNVFESGEQLIIGQNFTTANELNDFDLVIPVDAALGSHILRLRVIDASLSDPNDPCSDYGFGETHDYTVNIIDSTLNIDELELNKYEMIVTKIADREYRVTLESPIFTDQLVITMYNTLGQRLVRNRVQNVGGKYTYNLNLNGLSNDVYILRLGNNTYGKVKRIILH